MNQENNLPKKTEHQVKCASLSKYQIRPSLAEAFKGSIIKEIISNFLLDVLCGKQYCSAQISKWTSQIADDVNLRVSDLNMKRYRHVVQVLIAQQTGAGCRYIARCRWDADCDSLVSNYSTNESIACIVTVFGVYLY